MTIIAQVRWHSTVIQAFPFSQETRGTYMKWSAVLKIASTQSTQAPALH